MLFGRKKKFLDTPVFHYNFAHIDSLWHIEKIFCWYAISDDLGSTAQDHMISELQPSFLVFFYKIGLFV